MLYSIKSKRIRNHNIQITNKQTNKAIFYMILENVCFKKLCIEQPRYTNKRRDISYDTII